MNPNRRKSGASIAVLIVVVIVLFAMAGAYKVGKDLALRDNRQCSAPT